MLKPSTVTGKPFHFDSSLQSLLLDLDEKIKNSGAGEQTDSQSTLLDIYQQAKIDELYHSNKIEGNSLTLW